jgi:hypothetical protein
MTNRFSPTRIGIGTMLIGGGLGLLLVLCRCDLVDDMDLLCCHGRSVAQ